MQAHTESWERQQGESIQAYEAFCMYRDMGTDRSRRSVGVEGGQRSVASRLGKSLTLISRWSSAWQWQERVRAWDNNLVNEARKVAEKEVRDMTMRHIKIALQLQTKAVNALQELSITEMTAKDILAFILEGMKVERVNKLEEAPSQEDGGKGVQITFIGEAELKD